MDLDGVALGLAATAEGWVLDIGLDMVIAEIKTDTVRRVY